MSLDWSTARNFLQQQSSSTPLANWPSPIALFCNFFLTLSVLIYYHLQSHKFHNFTCISQFLRYMPLGIFPSSSNKNTRKSLCCNPINCVHHYYPVASLCIFSGQWWNARAWNSVKSDKLPHRQHFNEWVSFVNNAPRSTFVPWLASVWVEIWSAITTTVSPSAHVRTDAHQPRGTTIPIASSGVCFDPGRR